MRILTVFTSLVLTAQFSYATECLGPKDAKKAVVYFHGMDALTSNTSEIGNRETLNKIANELGIGIAMPHAKDKCPKNPDLYCWGWNFYDSKVIDNAIAEATAAKQLCFSEAVETGMVGFSNGGYVVNYTLRNCKKTPFDWAISMGAGSTWKPEDPISDLSSCGKFIFMVGDADTANNSVVHEMSPWLEKRKANYEIVEFSGGHKVPYDELKAQIKKLFKLE